MQLTAPQRALVRTAVLADPVANGYLQAGNAYSLLLWLNAAKAPAVLAWRTAVQPAEADQGPDYSAFNSLSAGLRDSWALFLNFPRDFAKAKVRKWIIDVWGNATAASNAEAVLLTGVESATNAQAAIGGTVRPAGTVSALDRLFAGQCDEGDANALVNNITTAQKVS